MDRITGSNDFFRGLSGILAQVKGSNPGIEATPYWHDGFTESATRFDALSVYNDEDLPHVTVIDQYRALTSKKTQRPTLDPKNTEAVLRTSLDPSSRFLISADGGKTYITFPHYRVMGLHNFTNRHKSAAIVTTRHNYREEDAPFISRQADAMILGAQLAYAQTVFGTFWLNPDVQTDEMRLFLTILKEGAGIRLQLGNDPQNAAVINRSGLYPLVGGEFAKDLDEIPHGNVIGPRDLIDEVAFYRLFNGARFFIHGSDTVSKPVENLDTILSDIKNLVGLKSFKSQIEEFAATMRYRKLRADAGLTDKEPLPLHTALVGPPGTCKSTSAGHLGRIYKSLGLLSKGHVVQASATDCIAKYVGQTGPKTRELIERARGGVLIIDEAYILNDKDGFGPEAIAELLLEMSEGPGDIAIVFAGYPGPMKSFISSNPGLKSRLGRVFEFDNYTPEELTLIGDVIADRFDVIISPEARTYLEKHLLDSFRGRDESFGNGRLVESILRDAKARQAVRLMNAKTKPDADALMIITLDDMKGALESKTIKPSISIPIDEAGLATALTELNNLDGLDEIKRDISNMVDLVRYYRDEGIEPKSKFRMNLVLSGNPGTGKTTVARLIGRIYKSLGLLERGHVVETDSSGLIANYVGQTATKTHAVIDSALDGVLYIDEAYMLTQRGQNGFESEALAALVKRMEDERGRFAVLISGYTDPMRQMLETNEGLQSRFDRTLLFRDYTPAQLTNFTLKTLAKNGLTPDGEAQKALALYFETRVKEKDSRTFGNMREARNAAETIVQKHDLRLSRIAKTDRTPEIKNTVTTEDVTGLGGDRPKAMKKPLGF